MPLIREGRPFIIYALVRTRCSRSTVWPTYLTSRVIGHGRTHGFSGQHHAPLTEWLRTLGYLKPYKVILEHGTNRRVVLPETTRAEKRGRKRAACGSAWLSSCLEAKWIKRFRRTIINANKTGLIEASLLLVNSSPLPWESEAHGIEAR